MSRYFIWQGGDNKWYYRTNKDGVGAFGTNYTAPTETTSTGFATYGLLQASLQATIFAETNYSEVAF